MIDSVYSDWQFFRIKGKRFLGLYRVEGVTILGPKFSTYGTYMSIRNFQKAYEKQGDSLRLPWGSVK